MTTNAQSQAKWSATQSRAPQIDWEAPNFNQMQIDRAQTLRAMQVSLFKVTEISEGLASAYRLSMANIMSSLCALECAIVYMLKGNADGVSLFVGVAGEPSASFKVEKAANALKKAFEGNFLGASLEAIPEADLPAVIETSPYMGLVTGVPTLNDREAHNDPEEFQGIERLANSLTGEDWQFLIVAQPASDQEIQATLDDICQLSSNLSEHIKHSTQRSENEGTQNSKSTSQNRSETLGSSSGQSTGSSETTTRGTSTSKGTSDSSGSKGSNQSGGQSDSVAKGTTTSSNSGQNKNKTQGESKSVSETQTRGTSVALTQERTEKRHERLSQHLSEVLIERFLRGRSKGMFHTAVYVSAPTQSTFEQLKQGVFSIFQGNQANVTPLRTLTITEPLSVEDLLQIHTLVGNPARKAPYSHHNALLHSLPIVNSHALKAATWLNTNELAIFASLPSRELPGFKIRKSVDFALNTGALAHEDAGVDLGCIVQHGRKLAHKRMKLASTDLNKHVFVTGVTGSGKTTTCMTLLRESGLPFMVIEPAKTEYRALFAQDQEIEYYTLGREDLTPFRLNPFELLPNQKNLAGHISAINATLAAVFPMEAAMPHIVEEAIINAYTAKGWDIHSCENFITDDPWAHDSDVWPTFSDMIRELDEVIASKGMGRDFEEKYRGSLVARLTNLTLGTKGRMLNTRRSLDFSRLLDKKVVIELEEMKSEEDKALFMGLILYRLAECMKHRHRQTPDFRHLTLVEEAHRLLSNDPSHAHTSKKMGVEMFANMLAEVRKYGEGLIIADQIPNKLIPDVIKNTHTKIVHRLFAADDRRVMGDSMSLLDAQKDFLPLLQTGETVVYCGGWHSPVRIQIEETTSTQGAEISEDEIRLRGQQQVWMQRDTLAPRLAQQHSLGQEEFAKILNLGTKALNLLLKLLQSKVKADKTRPKMPESARDMLFESLADKLEVLKQEFQLSTQFVAHILACVFLDNSTHSELPNEDSLNTLFPQLVELILAENQTLPRFETALQNDRSLMACLSHEAFFETLSV